MGDVSHNHTDEAVWRVCQVITGDCHNCPASEMIHGDECTRGCRMQAEECVNVVETGNPWRKTSQDELRGRWVALHQAPTPRTEDGSRG